jgi:hypothetical protein
MKHISKILLSASAAVSICGLAGTTSAGDIYQIQNVSGGSLDLFLQGFMSQGSGTRGNVTDSASVQFDWAAPSAKFQSLSLAFSGDTYTQSHSYTVGPGQTKTITASVCVDPFTLYASGLQQFALRPGQNGLYDAGYGQYGTFGPLSLSGRVVITGPTESTTVPFSLSFPSDPNIHFLSLVAVDTHAYPTTVTLQGAYDIYTEECDLSYWFAQSPITLANATVDGVNVNITASGAQAGTIGTFDLHPVPEPSVLALGGLGLFAMLSLRRATVGQRPRTA